MSVEIQAPAQSMFESTDSLKVTPLPMHKFYFELKSLDQWYTIMREARLQFGKNWRGQRGIRRRLELIAWDSSKSLQVWFEVPDSNFGTWIGIKHAVIPVSSTNK